MFLLVVKYYYHIEIKEYEMGGACRTQRRGSKCIQFGRQEITQKKAYNKCIQHLDKKT
jgi:hypothetical protein